MAVLQVQIDGTSEGLARSLQSAISNLNRFDQTAGSVTTSVSRNIANINRINFSGFQSSLRAGEISLNSFAMNAQRITPALSSASSAVNRSSRDFTAWSRIIQDAPFGLIGIQNNLTQLLPAAGLAGLALSAVVSALTFTQTGTSNWTRGLDGNKKAIEGTKKASDEYIDSLNQVAQAQIKGAQNANKEIVELRTLYDISQNTSLSYKTRKDAVDELQKQYPAYFKNIRDEVILAGEAADKYKALTASIIATARARAAQDLIAKNSDKILEIENKLVESGRARTKLERERNAERKTATSFLDLDLSRDTKLLSIYKEQNDLKTERNNLERKNAELAGKITKEVAGGADLSGPVGGLDSTGKSVKSLSDILGDLQKSLAKTEVQFGSTFGERNKAQIAAYQSAIDAATDSFGKQSKAVKDLQAEQRKLLQLSDLPQSPSTAAATAGKDLPRNSKGGLNVLPDLVKKGLPTEFDKGLKKEIDDFNRDIANSVNRFGRRFGETLFTLNDQADQSFQGIFTSLSKELTNALKDVFLNQFTNLLSKSLQESMSALTANQRLTVAGVGLAGGLVSGATKKTSSAGQALGGALTGGAAGFAVGGPIGAAVGGLIGAIGGLFGAKKARKEEELQKKQLAEQEKQTKLLERQNALAYTSSIIGRMTTQGVVTGVEVNEFGQLTTKISGNDLEVVLNRSRNSRQRGA